MAWGTSTAPGLFLRGEYMKEFSKLIAAREKALSVFNKAKTDLIGVIHQIDDALDSSQALQAQLEEEIALEKAAQAYLAKERNATVERVDSIEKFLAPTSI